jgi:hypothetical protein
MVELAALCSCLNAKPSQILRLPLKPPVPSSYAHDAHTAISFVGQLGALYVPVQTQLHPGFPLRFQQVLSTLVQVQEFRLGGMEFCACCRVTHALGFVVVLEIQLECLGVQVNSSKAIFYFRAYAPIAFTYSPIDIVLPLLEPSTNYVFLIPGAVCTFFFQRIRAIKNKLVKNTPLRIFTAQF